MLYKNLLDYYFVKHYSVILLVTLAKQTHMLHWATWYFVRRRAMTLDRAAGPADSDVGFKAPSKVTFCPIVR